MISTDKELTRADIQELANREGIASFFAKLGYGTDVRMLQTCAAMGITAESLQRQVKHIERVAIKEGGAEPLDVYLIELTSVTMVATQGLARALRNRVGNYLLILTDAYERIDFVLLQRSLLTASTTALTTKQVVVRPRILTVDRRNPTPVQLRVLRRFSCTEIDSDAQYEKLLSAYSVAEWSEPLFNNRALFSDYYLNERLPETPEWRERSEGVYQSLRKLVANIHQRLSSADIGNTRESIIEPALSTLGFKATSIDNSGNYYRLCSNRTTSAPVALCLAYTWNRNLDGYDETRDTESPDENPGARVVSLLESGEAPWVIVTNGKLWRLYSAKAHSRATNYYEIDLDETLAMDAPNEAFRYFWLFFRAAAFVPRDIVRNGQSCTLSFLDELVEESEDYAKGLGERLKERVFEEIFPHFAKGFIEYLRAQPPITGAYQSALLPVTQQLALKQEPDESFRRQVFQGTLTFLYRLLFLLYAESRGLLPVKEERGYWEHSITRMKEEIASKAGTIVDEAYQKLAKTYSDQSTTLYDRLLELFAHIDQGSREMNLPLYNGGLFISRPSPDGHTPEVENARFLLSNKIPDRYLALGLDRLTRDEDQKRHDLVFIDYKSLGVRQLGSMYEGLLEFRIRIASEKMAVVQGKKTEEVIPYEEAVTTGRKVLARGRGKNAEERIYRPGEVYLENDRRERKATGSYYTPDHIVEYIAQHTIGPVLEEKFEKLRSIFREAQQAYRNALQRAEGFRKQGMKPDNPAKVANTYSHLVDELFDLRVLDPAMGSGHFLVEAVDYVCDRILGQKEGFLQAFPWNPVTAFLEKTRQAILAEMERQSVTIDASRLTDINLLKRHILKRCIYGVDLNPMAVELAKVSLWLDCFTLGAPLSFLNHHLKFGNSLIGTTVQDVEAELAVQKKGHVGDLFGGPFQGLLSATAFVEELRRLPDATIEQAERSHALYEKFEEAMAPYKAALDIWVSRYFGNKLAQEYLTLVGQNYVEEIRSEGKGLSPQYQEVITKAAQIGREKRFFHWDLEFPEAFVDLERNTWKPREGQGFDAVFGNPPYDVLATEELGYDVSQDLSYYKSIEIYSTAIRGKTNLYKLFILKAMSLIVIRGAFSFIVPMVLLGDDQARELRRTILENGSFVVVDAFPQKDDPRKRVFPEAKLATVVFVVRGQPSSSPFCVRTHSGRFIEEATERLYVCASDIFTFNPVNMSIPSCTQRDWDIAMNLISLSNIKRLGDYCKASQGELNETTDSRRGFISHNPKVGPQILRGSNISMYVLREASQGTPIFLLKEKFLDGKPSSVKAWHHLQRRVGWQEGSPQNNFRRVIAAMIPLGNFCNHLINYLPEENSKLDLDFVLALLNSEIIDWFFRLESTNNAVSHYQIHSLPAPSIANDREHINWENKIKQSQWKELKEQLCNSCNKPGIMPNSVAEALAEMSRHIQRIEATRVLKNRSERSRLADESQPIQNVIDAVLFRCYGLSDDDARYVEQRLKEML